MKASEMTNEELANWLAIICCSADLRLPARYRSYLRDAAARLRKIDGLNAKLKVVEDALAKLQERLVSGVYDGTIDPYEALKIAETALAALRVEGGAK